MRRRCRLTTCSLHRLDKFFSSCINKTLSARKDIQLSKIHGPEDSEPSPPLPCEEGAHRKGASRRSSRLAETRKKKDGGAGRDRTDDLRLAKTALSQLSYSPTKRTDPARQNQVNTDRPASCVPFEPCPVVIPQTSNPPLAKRGKLP